MSQHFFFLPGRLPLSSQEARLEEALDKVRLASILLGISGQAPNPISKVPSSNTLCGSSAGGGGAPLKPLVRKAASGGVAGAPSAATMAAVGGVLGAHASESVNWKGSFVVDAAGRRRDLSAEELEAIRKERNRMHAKMTRERKKQLVTGLEQVSPIAVAPFIS